MATLSGVPGVIGGLVGGVEQGVGVVDDVGVAARELDDELGAVVAGEAKNSVIFGWVAAAADCFMRLWYVLDAVTEWGRFCVLGFCGAISFEMERR